MNHTELDLERTLAYHGAPAMAGIKSADLIAWGSPEACSTPLFRQYQHQLARRVLDAAGIGRLVTIR